MKKSLIVLLIMVGYLLSACGSNADDSAPAGMAWERIAEAIEQADPESLTLTIYHFPDSILTRAPLTVDQLKTHPKTEIAILRGDELAEILPALTAKLRAAQPDPVQVLPWQYARLYYVLEADGKKLLDVSCADGANGLFVNGTEYEFDKWFYQLVEPYFPKAAEADA